MFRERSSDITLQRMDNVGIVVDDLAAAVAFFRALGLELEGETTVEGSWVDRVVGLDGVRADIAMMRTPDRHSRLELSKFHTPKAARVEARTAPANTLGIGRISLPSTTSRMSLPAVVPTAPNSLAKWSSTRT